MMLKINRRTGFYSLLACLLIFLFLRNAFQLVIPMMLLSLIVIAAMALGNRDEMIAMLLCCIPLHSTLDLFLIMGSGAILYLVKNYSRMRLGGFVVLVLVMLFWEFLHCFEVGFSLKITLGAVVALVVLAVIVSSDIENVDYSFVIRVMAIFSLCVCMVCFMNLLMNADFNVLTALKSMQRLGDVYEGDSVLSESINPNTLGIINLLVVSALIQLRFLKQNKKSDNIIIFVLLLFGLLTASRTFLVCVLVAMLCFVMGLSGTLMKKLRFLAMMLLFAGIIALVYMWIFPDSFNFFVSRFLDGNILGGRDTLMSEYHEYLFSHADTMIFGVGLSNFAEKVTHTITDTVPHNCIQEIIVAWGIPGLCMMLLMIVMMIWEAKKRVKRMALMNYIPLILILFKSLAGQFLTSAYTMLALILVFLSLCQNFQLQETNESDYELVASKTNL